jgi:hypothetical protein
VEGVLSDGHSYSDSRDPMTDNHCPQVSIVIPFYGRTPEQLSQNILGLIE